jgi:glycerol uptake facilitator-like aquaporin
MDRSLLRAYVVELIGSFALVFFGAGVVCVNAMTTPSGQAPGATALLSVQPGLVGIALAQGLILAVALSVTVPVSGGYLNPAISLMLWVFNRLDSARASWLIGAQLLGSVLGAWCVRSTFGTAILRDARLGTPHLNPLVFHPESPVIPRGALVTGTGIEVVLTFFVVVAIFGVMIDGPRPRLAGLGAGLAWTAGILLGFPLTGGATNPARWFGPALLELTLPEAPPAGPFADAFVYIAGPLLGALAGGLVAFKLLLPGVAPAPETGPRSSEAVKPGPSQRQRK